MQNEEQQQPIENPQLALEKERVKRLELERSARREQKQNEKLAAENRAMKFNDQLRREIASSGVGDFYPDDSELQRILEGKYGAKFLIRDTGEFNVEIAGRQAAFTELVQRLAVESPTLLKDRNSIKHLQPEQPIRSKADLKTNSDRLAYIEKFGVSRYESLPLRSVPDGERATITADQYRAMSAAQKVALRLTEYEIGYLLKHGSLRGYEKN